MLTLHRDTCKNGRCISVEFNNKTLMGALDVGAALLVRSIAIMQKMGGYGCNGRLLPKMHEQTDVDR
jgi:hypothetical protein